MRLHLDRDSTAYKAIYRQRTAAERINSQATALGIERPKVRTAAAVRNLNTLTYLVINLHALAACRRDGIAGKGRECGAAWCAPVVGCAVVVLEHLSAQ